MHIYEVQYGISVHIYNVYKHLFPVACMTIGFILKLSRRNSAKRRTVSFSSSVLQLRVFFLVLSFSWYQFLWVATWSVSLPWLHALCAAELVFPAWLPIHCLSSDMDAAPAWLCAAWSAGRLWHGSLSVHPPAPSLCKAWFLSCWAPAECHFPVLGSCRAPFLKHWCLISCGFFQYTTPPEGNFNSMRHALTSISHWHFQWLCSSSEA
jgi:hypothetical protein